MASQNLLERTSNVLTFWQIQKSIEPKDLTEVKNITRFMAPNFGAIYSLTTSLFLRDSQWKRKNTISQARKIQVSNVAHEQIKTDLQQNENKKKVKRTGT